IGKVTGAIRETETQTTVGNNRHIDERLRVRPPVLIVQIKDAGSSPGVLVLSTYIKDASIGIQARISTKEHRVRDRKNGGVYSDAQSEHHHGHNGESGIFAKATQRVMNILQHLNQHAIEVATKCHHQNVRLWSGRKPTFS